MASAALPSITIRALLFGSYADLLGHDSVELSIPAPATIGDVVEQIRKLPGGERLPPRPLCAINLQHASPREAIAEGDEVALLPPLAGG